MEVLEKQVSLPLLLFAFLPLFLLFPASSLALGEHQRRSDCSPLPYECGRSKLNISYPFWTDGSFGDGCSQQRKEFEIACNRTDNSSEIEIQSRKYHVEKIDYENQTLTVVDKVFFGSKSADNSCRLSSFENTTLDFRFFNYYDGEEGILTFLHNCVELMDEVAKHSSHGNKSQESQAPPDIHNCPTHFETPQTHPDLKYLKLLRCPSNSCTYLTIEPEIPVGFEDCQVVKIPILKQSKDRLEKGGPESNAEDIWKVLRNGFQITWSPIDPWNQCGNCVRSNGHCGLNASFLDQQPICYCNGQAQSHTCGGDKKNKKEHTVIIGKLRNGRDVAVKRLYENNCRCVEQFKNEIKILSSLLHQNLVALYGCSSRHSRELLLVYEFIPNGTMADHLHGDRAKPGALMWPTRMRIAIETADALKYLHAVGIIHCDVKTNNILLDNNFHVKVADFGLSRLSPTNVTHISTSPQGTPGYVDPDYHRCFRLTDKSDVYSFGVILIELISSKPAVDITRHQHEISLAIMALNKIYNSALNELVDPSLGFDSNYGVRRMITLVAELAFRCLQDEKESRPSMEEVLEQLRGIESEEYNVEKVEVN